MNRTTLLAIGLLALLLAACGGSPASQSTAASEDEAPSIQPTPAPEESEAAPSEPAEPSEDDGTGSSGTPLANLLPDSIGGEARQDLPLFDEATLAAMFAQQGVDVGEVDFVIATYGESGLAVTAIRVPDLEQANMEMMARMMAGMPETQGSVESVSLGGKTVVALTATDGGETGYLYFADGAAFVVAGGTEDQAAELLSQLP